MNKTRRKEIEREIAKLETIASDIEDICNNLEEVMDDEENALNSMPESLQDSDRGCDMQENVDTIGYVADSLDEKREEIEELIDNLREVVER